ncbi:hypothetical protein G5I_12069 [Acromyrmex echinatior]|uniref:Uncharacterized protein n=1 Tax=Acromyrmex echinatior TaxID=103372 RepID=F4X1B0_ACREC|nr:hypothetical protein G5I_12069 [Acromyrmex echinatior]
MDGDRLAVLWVDFAARLAVSTCSCRTNVLAFWPERAGARGRGRGGAHEPAGVSVGSGHSLGRAYTLDIRIGKNFQQDSMTRPGGFLTRVVHNGKEGYIALQDISYVIAHHPVTSSATEVDIRSPRFDVGYIIRRSEYAPSGFEREER